MESNLKNSDVIRTLLEDEDLTGVIVKLTGQNYSTIVILSHKTAARSLSAFHEIGGALGVAVLSSIAGAGLAASTVSTHGFREAFWAGAIGAIGAIGAPAAVIIAVLLAPAVRRSAAGPAHRALAVR